MKTNYKDYNKSIENHSTEACMYKIFSKENQNETQLQKPIKTKMQGSAASRIAVRHSSLFSGKMTNTKLSLFSDKTLMNQAKAIMKSQTSERKEETQDLKQKAFQENEDLKMESSEKGERNFDWSEKKTDEDERKGSRNEEEKGKAEETAAIKRAAEKGARRSEGSAGRKGKRLERRAMSREIEAEQETWESCSIMTCGDSPSLTTQSQPHRLSARRRAVNSSDLRTCVLVQSKLKTQSGSRQSSLDDSLAHQLLSWSALFFSTALTHFSYNPSISSG